MKLTEHVVSGRANQVEKNVPFAELSNYYPPLFGFRFNFVTQGMVDFESSSDVISSKIDRAILRQIRSVSDLIVTSGKTARRENLAGSRFAPILVLTNHDRLEARLCSETTENMVFVTSDKHLCANANSYSVGKTTQPLSEWISGFCKDYNSVVLETGLTLARGLSSLIDEIDLTVTKASSVNDALASASAALERIGLESNLEQLIEIDSDFFFRYKVS